MKTRLAALSVALLSLCTGAPAGAASFDSIVVIGDSLSDPGNVAFRTFGLFPPTPPYNSRATNGTTAIEQLAGQWGITLEASTAGGTNYGHIGALTGQMTVTHVASGQTLTTENFADPEYGLGVLRTGTGMQSQLGSYLGSSPAFDPATTLFTVWGGPNDLFLALASTNPGSVAAGVGRALADNGRTRGEKKPDQLGMRPGRAVGKPRFPAALAVFVERPQADRQIGAGRKTKERPGGCQAAGLRTAGGRGAATDRL